MALRPFHAGLPKGHNQSQFNILAVIVDLFQESFLFEFCQVATDA